MTGRGTGIDDATLARKIEFIDAGIARLGERNAEPLERLAALGSADFAAAVGFMIGSARRGVPVLVDGVIAAAEAVIAEALVPGDVIRVSPGDRVPADVRLLDASNLQVEESALTGESLPAAKTTTPVAADAGVGDRASMLFSSTVVSAGTAV